MFEVFYELLRPGGDETGQIPAQFRKLIRETLDLKNDIEFGYTITRSEMTYNMLLGSRAYQKAFNRITREENERRERESRN